MENPIPSLLWCPVCHARHIDEGEFADKPHHTHACQGCGAVWRPALVPTVGVRFLPGFQNEGVLAAEERLLSACRSAMIVTGAPEEFLSETSERAIREAIIELRGVERESGRTEKSDEAVLGAMEADRARDIALGRGRG